MNFLRARGFTLIEVMVTVGIVAIVGLAIVAGITYGVVIQQNIKERNSAMRAAAEVIEETKRTPFFSLAPITYTKNDVPLDPVVTLDDRGTVSTDDDVLAESITLRFYNTDGTAATTPINERKLVVAKARVQWRGAGRKADSPEDYQQVMITTLLAP
ncbi:type II secretion system GspH family protein [bacterium]|nr:type II secretion system GspH family protein [bacterium]